MKTAQIEITKELLKQVLCIPDNVDISGMRHNWESPTHNTFTIRLYGDGLPDACGDPKDRPPFAEPPMLMPTYFRDNEQEIVSSVTWRVQ